MANILGVGIATLDIINTVDSYPAEDMEVRALEQRLARGGNCTNTLVVLSQLGHCCHWAGTLAAEPDARHILDDLKRFRVNADHCVTVPQGKVPTSYVVLNRRTGSRTIVHYRDLPELDTAAFERIPLDDFQWLHFEGRNVADTRRMMDRTRLTHPQVPRSLEVEKPRPNIEYLLPLADVVIFSRAYILAGGESAADRFLQRMAGKLPGTILAAPWGEEGAFAMDAEGNLHHSPAFAPEQVMDTLGAGDTFNAGFIDGMLRSGHVGESLQAGCRIAGIKCGLPGFDLSGTREIRQR